MEVWRRGDQRFGEVEVTKIWLEFRVLEVERCGEMQRKGIGGVTRCKRDGEFTAKTYRFWSPSSRLRHTQRRDFKRLFPGRSLFQFSSVNVHLEHVDDPPHSSQ